MGFHLRKTFKTGLFNFNLSNSGIGTSFGVKGFRFGVDGKGRTYIGGGKGIFRYRQYLTSSSNDNVIILNEVECPSVSLLRRTSRLIIGYIIGLLLIILNPSKNYTVEQTIISYNILWLYFSPLILNVLLGIKNTAGFITLNFISGWTVVVPIIQILMSCIKFIQKRIQSKPENEKREKIRLIKEYNQNGQYQEALDLLDSSDFGETRQLKMRLLAKLERYQDVINMLQKEFTEDEKMNILLYMLLWQKCL